MENQSMTALISAFARAWHTRHAAIPVYADPLAEQLLGDDFAAVAGHMAAGAAYFLPGFQGTQEEALQQIVCRQLAPSPLGRAAFCEDHLRRAAEAGCSQYLLLGAGYDTLPYRQSDWMTGMTVLELDHPATAADKLDRLNRAGIGIPANVLRVSADLTDPDWPRVLREEPGFRGDAPTFVSLLGLVYYLPGRAFAALLEALAALLAPGSMIAMDYPEEGFFGGASGQADRQSQLAQAAGEPMQTGYTPQGMADVLSRAGFTVAEDLAPADITARYFAACSAAQPDAPIAAAEHVRYCLARK
ncbi:MAG: class I SAM-dependent methyltransferase [Aristaeellaceae bacterium]